MDAALARYAKDETIVVTEENYLEVMELIYTYPSEFIGKKITYDGFVYHADQDDANEIFCFVLALSIVWLIQAFLASSGITATNNGRK